MFAARIDREPHGGARLTDFQSVAINNSEQGWTTRGYPEGRSGGTYQNHLRYRDYFADMGVTVVLRLQPEEDSADARRVGGGAAGTRPPPVHRTQALPAVLSHVRRFHRRRYGVGCGCERCLFATREAPQIPSRYSGPAARAWKNSYQHGP